MEKTYKSEFAIDINGLNKSFGKVHALENMTFSIPYGMIAGFVGPNGAGKTTTLRILATLMKQDHGTVRVLGHDVAVRQEAEMIRRSIGFMPDYFGLYTDMTAGEYLDFFGAAYHIPAQKRQALVNDILALVNLDEKRDTLIAGLSRGMQQKLTLGRCLIHSPELLLLDEPASGLDPRARIELLELLKELKVMGKTIFISSHILSELHNLCDMVVIIERGKTVYTGSIDDASTGSNNDQKYMEIKVLGDQDQAMDCIGQINGVMGIRRQEALIIVEHTTDCLTADIIEACVKNGIRIEEARKGGANLEQIFMQLTSGE